MPYQWLPSPTPHLRLWPYRSLTTPGFVLFIGTTATLLAMPVIIMLGTPVLWMLLPFPAAAVAGIWWAIRRNDRDAAIVEDLRLSETEITLTRQGPHRKHATWQANPHWVQVHLYPTGGRVPQYLTLRGAGREVEIGAFLSEEERLTLCLDLKEKLAAARHA
jgi:uncharacterized membrane protein